MDDRMMLRSLMGGLIERAGGVEASAALIGARLGHEVSKGSVSKRQSGHLDWPLVEIMALEDAVGDPVVRRWLARGLPEVTEGRDLMARVGDSLREHGEALASVMALIGGSGSRVAACKEVQDAMAALAQLARALEEGGDA